MPSPAIPTAILKVVVLLLAATVINVESLLELPNGVTCPVGYTRRPGSLSCYKFYWKEVGLGVDMNFAQKQCQQDDRYGNLVIIDDLGEYEFLKFLWPTCSGDECQKQYFWIGATQAGSEWQWIDETPFPSYVPWDQGYPLRDGKCVGLVYKNDRVLFVNSPCYVPFHFICEVDLTPDPCTPQPVFFNAGGTGTVATNQISKRRRRAFNGRDPFYAGDTDDEGPASLMQRAGGFPPPPQGFGLRGQGRKKMGGSGGGSAAFTSTIYIGHPFYAQKFVYCSSEKGRIVKNCPQGLYWNANVMRCAKQPFGKDEPEKGGAASPPRPLAPPLPPPGPPINPLLLNLLRQG